MTDAIYIQSMRWSKPCSKCGKEIPIGTAGFWLKAEHKYYHDNNSCYDTKASNQPKPQEAPAGSKGNIESPPSSREQTNRELIDKEILARLDRAEKLADKFLTEHNELDYSMKLALVPEIAHQLYGLEQTKRIQQSRGIL